jgi:hypothetical protein
MDGDDAPATARVTTGSPALMTPAPAGAGFQIAVFHVWASIAFL